MKRVISIPLTFIALAGCGGGTPSTAHTSASPSVQPGLGGAAPTQVPFFTQLRANGSSTFIQVSQVPAAATCSGTARPRGDGTVPLPAKTPAPDGSVSWTIPSSPGAQSTLWYVTCNRDNVHAQVTVELPPPGPAPASSARGSPSP